MRSSVQDKGVSVETLRKLWIRGYRAYGRAAHEVQPCPNRRRSFARKSERLNLIILAQPFTNG